MNAEETCPYRGIKNTLAMQDHLRSWKHIWLGIFIMMVCARACVYVYISIGEPLEFLRTATSLEFPREPSKKREARF